ncbi:uncharacterized protein LOC126836701 [Adelges cooleyi]|uniref:uncharacterized protein LOC126836701 n=1 Tax=Adelges cooleyi TaxID=133065 RepID=UPI0021806308|nr:uncharacterized protein LOC126836701 [Adelges cooleyi]
MYLNVLCSLALVMVCGYRCCVTDMDRETFLKEIFALLANSGWKNITHVETKLNPNVDRYYTVYELLDESDDMADVQEKYLLTVDLLGCVYMDALLKYLNLLAHGLTCCRQALDAADVPRFKGCIMSTVRQIKYSAAHLKRLYAAVDYLRLVNHKRVVPVSGELPTYLRHLRNLREISETKYKLNGLVDFSHAQRVGGIEMSDWEDQMNALTEFVGQAKSSLTEDVDRKCKLHDKRDMDMDELWRFYKVETPRSRPPNADPVGDVETLMNEFWKQVKSACLNDLGLTYLHQRSATFASFNDNAKTRQP